MQYTYIIYNIAIVLYRVYMYSIVAIIVSPISHRKLTTDKGIHTHTLIK